MQINMFIGNVAKEPELSGTGEHAVCKVVLIDNQYAGKDERGEAREKAVSIQFTAFRNRAEAIAKHVMKGDQLALQYRIENNHYKRGEEDVYGYNFVVEEFKFGAPGKEKRAALAAG